MLKRWIATRLDHRYARRTRVTQLEKKIDVLSRRLSALEATSASPAPATPDGEWIGELRLLRQQVVELTRLVDRA